MEPVMIRIDRECYDRLKEVCGRHPLKPTMKAALERAIQLMIEDFEVEIDNARQ
jgi:hypothetical protein